jgi:hypothetical protein
MRTIVQPDRMSLFRLFAYRRSPIWCTPQEGVFVLRGRSLWAHPSPNAESLVETRLSGQLHMNSQILVAGARYVNYMQIEIEPFPLVA